MPQSASSHPYSAEDGAKVTTTQTGLANMKEYVTPACCPTQSANAAESSIVPTVLNIEAFMAQLSAMTTKFLTLPAPPIN